MFNNTTVSRVVFGTVGTALCAAICLIGATAPAFAAEAPRTAIVHYTDLDLAQASGRAVLDKRIARAAYKVCRTDGTSSADFAAQQRCIRDAAAQVRMPAVTVAFAPAG